MFKRGLAATAVVLLALLVVAHPATAATKDKARVYEFATGAPVTGAFATLDRSDDAIASKVRTRGIADHAYTLWYVIFNARENCTGGACGPDDIFNTDGSFNVAQIAATRLSVISGQAGAVANPAGRVALDGGLAVGEIPSGPNRLVIGLEEDGALVPLGVVSGLEDALGGEVHIVLQDHGPAQEDPELREQQLTMFAGACNPDCVDAQFAIHLP